MQNSDLDRQLWDRLPGEPAIWFNRFHRYLMMPGKRSLLGTCNNERVEKGRKGSTSVTESWQNAFRQWKWAERAEAFDAFQRKLQRQR